MIYFVRQEGSNYIKIGFTDRNHKERICDLQTANPRKLELLTIVDGDEATEAEYHRKYWQYKTDGGTEWFELPPSVIEQIKGLYHDRHDEDRRSFAGTTALDVRPLRGRQQYSTPEPGKDVPGWEAFGNTCDKSLFSALRRKR